MWKMGFDGFGGPFRQSLFKVLFSGDVGLYLVIALGVMKTLGA